MKTALGCVLLLIAIALGGCGPRWAVIKQANPNPMNARSSFKVDKATFDPDFRVGDDEKTEAQWMSDKRAETRDSWDGDKAAMADRFVGGFMAERGNLLVATASGSGVFAVRAKYVRYEPGFYAVVTSKLTSLEAEVEFLDASGNVVDVIRITARYGAHSAGEGARYCSREIGIIAAEYLKERVGH